jgi:hypothetical protein
MSVASPRMGLVYLAWGGLGMEPVGEFLDSYARHSAGLDHELVVLLNGVSTTQRLALLDVLDGVDHRTLELEEPSQDLAAYGRAAQRLEHEHLCFLNSYSVVLAEGWLGTLAQAAWMPGVGLAGASGSWESQATWRRGRPGDWLGNLRGIRTRRRDFPRFPNPHLRTTAFTIRRSLLLELGLERARDKYSAYLLESGRNSITRMVQDRGLSVVVVGRDGHLYDTPQWASSATFRAGGQANLLVADNRTRDWAQASPTARMRLSRDTWGRR